MLDNRNAPNVIAIATLVSIMQAFALHARPLLQIEFSQIVDALTELLNRSSLIALVVTGNAWSAMVKATIVHNAEEIGLLSPTALVLYQDNTMIQTI